MSLRAQVRKQTLGGLRVQGSPRTQACPLGCPQLPWAPCSCSSLILSVTKFTYWLLLSSLSRWPLVELPEMRKLDACLSLIPMFYICFSYPSNISRIHFLFPFWAAVLVQALIIYQPSHHGGLCLGPSPPSSSQHRAGECLSVTFRINGNPAF